MGSRPSSRRESRILCRCSIRGLRIFPNKNDSNPIMPQLRYVPSTDGTNQRGCNSGNACIISETSMSRVLSYLPRVAIFVAGVAAGAVTLPRRSRSGMDAAAMEELRKSLAGLENRIQEKDAAVEARFGQVEARLEEHTARLADVPSTSQIVAAMEQLLSKTMASLDERLSTQANSIEVLRSTVSQTDTLLERVLESLDSLQTYSERSELAEDPILSRPGV